MIKLRLAAGILCALLTVFGVYESAAQEGGIVRLHVIANSNSAADQALKMKVRDEVLAFMQADPALNGAQPTIESTQAAIKENGKALLTCVENTLRENGVSYGAQLYYGLEDYPERVYNGGVYPAGEYLSLRVTLGSGAGENWWCVLFPPLCLVNLDEESDPAGELYFESAILKFLRKRRLIK